MTHLVDATLLPCNFGEGFSKHEGMVKPQRGDPRSQRLRYDISAVIFTADSDFQDRHINLSCPLRWNGRRAENKAHFESKEDVIGHQS